MCFISVKRVLALCAQALNSICAKLGLVLSPTKVQRLSIPFKTSQLIPLAFFTSHSGWISGHQPFISKQRLSQYLNRIRVFLTGLFQLVRQEMRKAWPVLWGGLQGCSLPLKYSGLPLGASHKSTIIWSDIAEKIEKRSAG